MESTRNKLVRVKISSIVLYDEVIKEYDLKLFEKLKRGIKKRGQLKNIIICESENGFECLEGSKIVKALKDLEQDSVIAYNLGVLSEEDKKIIRIELFRDFFLTNYVYIGKLLKEITQTAKLDEICNTIPFDLRQAKHLINMHEFDWDSFNQDKQNEGQSSLFDIFEPDNVNETPIQEKKIENSFDDKLYILKGTGVISESNEISIDKEFDERYLKSYEKATEELISEVKNENQVEVGFVSVNDLSKKVEESKEVVEDKDFNDLIDGKTEKQENEIKQSSNKLNSILNASGNEIKIGDVVLFSTARKGEFEVKVTKYTPKWVYYIETSTQKETYIEMDKFIKSSKLILEQNSSEKTNETLVLVVEKEDENISLEFNDFVSSKTESETIECEKENEDEDNFDHTNFYIDEKSKSLVIKKYNNQVLEFLNKLCVDFAEEKYKESFTKCEIEHRIMRNGETIITSVNCLNKFANKYSLPLHHVLNLIKKIDLSLFEKPIIKTDSFYYDYENKELVLIKNKEVILQNIPLIAKKILYEKWNQTCEPEKIDVTIKDEVEQVLVTHVTHTTEYNVTIRVILEEIAEVLMKIDFE